MPHKKLDFSFPDFLTTCASELMTTVDVLDSNTLFRTIPSWTSLNALLLISKLNELTGVFISSSDLANIKTLGELYTLVVSKHHGPQ